MDYVFFKNARRPTSRKSHPLYMATNGEVDHSAKFSFCFDAEPSAINFGYGYRSRVFYNIANEQSSLKVEANS